MPVTTPRRRALVSVLGATPRAARWLSRERLRVLFGVNAALLLVLLAATFQALDARDQDFAGDDAFISFAYASNLASGEGLVFNPGEYVWGFTSPLQTLLLGGLAAAGFDLVVTAPRLSVLWVCLTSLVLFLLCRRFLPDWLALLVCLCFATAHGSVSALETKLLVLLQCGFLLLLVSGRPRSASLAASLACLTRPDAVLLVVPGLLATRASRTPACLALFALPGVAWLLFAYLYYGDLLPNSLHAKQGFTAMSVYLAHHFQQFTAAGLPGELSFLTGWLFALFADPRLPAIALFLALSLGVLLNRRLREKPALLYALLVYPWTLLVAYAAIGSIKYHEWEIHSGLFFCQLAALIGLFTLVQRARERWPALRHGVLVVVLALGLASSFLHAQQFLQRVAKASSFGQMAPRHRAYQRISEWINLNVPVTATLSAVEVGTIGYYTQVHIIDVAGIVTRGYAPEERLDHDVFARRFEPGYMLVAGDVPALRPGRGLFYRRVQYFPSDGFSFSLLARR